MENNSPIRFVWDIHHDCNYRCPHCWFYGQWAVGKKESLYLTVNEWIRHWDKVYEKYGSVFISITGGEPSIYPSFTDLIKSLSERHFVSFITNLSFDVRTFLSTQVSPSRVGLGLSFHPLYSKLKNFLTKAKFLKEEGFDITTYFVAYPPQMHMINYLKETFEKEGLNFRLMAFWGKYNSKNYPEDYTEEQKECVTPLLDSQGVTDYNINKKSPKGKLCYAGVKSVNISHQGKVFKCGPMAPEKGKLGNIVDADFKMLDRPKPCEATFCQCDNFKNLDEEQR